MKNILIGFLLATCMFLLIGATEKPSILKTPPEELIKQLIGINNSKPGKYQISINTSEVVMVNTETGVLYSWEKEERQWNRLSPKADWIKE